jgi:effector-binding domain-containing protein
MAYSKHLISYTFSTLSLVIIFTIFTIGGAMATEQAKYQLIFQEDDFEVRLYEPHIVAQTEVSGEFEDAGSAAFKRLFDYISGDNIAQQEIAMTAPVGQQATGEKIAMTSPVGQRNENGRWIVSFMMPASYDYDTLPKPKDPSITLRKVPAQYIASITYSGLWSESNYLSNKDKLLSWIKTHHYNITGDANWARYNAPFTPWFLRRNEILIPIENPLPAN